MVRVSPLHVASFPAFSNAGNGRRGLLTLLRRGVCPGALFIRSDMAYYAAAPFPLIPGNFSYFQCLAAPRALSASGRFYASLTMAALKSAFSSIHGPFPLKARYC